MARVKSSKEPPKLVWRISANAPLGEFVDPKQAAKEAAVAAATKPAPSARETREHGWLASSLELLGGVRVSETPMDTLPGDLIDQFMAKPKKP